MKKCANLYGGRKMKYIVDDKNLDAATFIAFANQIWQGSYNVEKTQDALSKTGCGQQIFKTCKR